MNEIIIRTERLYKSYDLSTPVLNGLDLSVLKGEILSIVGESGSGKSTLLNVLSGLDQPTQGKVWVLGRELTQVSEDERTEFRGRFFGFVFQFHYLLSDFTAVENVMLPYLNLHYNRKLAEERARKLLKEVGLEKKAKSRPSQLSGGEQQRLTFARALMNRPKILFADEPTGNLDEKNAEHVKEIMWELRAHHSLTLVLVTHNRMIAEKADRIIQISSGKIREIQDLSFH